MSETGTRPGRRRTRLGMLRRVVGVLALASALVSITIQLRSGAEPEAYLPPLAVDTSTGIEVLAEAAVEPLLLVEQRAAPDRRILRYDPVTGDVRTVRLLTDDEQVNGLAMHPDGTRVALAYAPERDVRGIGLSILDLATGDLTPLVAPQPGRFLLDPSWAPDGSRLYLTQVVVVDAGPRWSVVVVDPDDGGLEVVATDALTPAPTDHGVYVLRPDVDGNGRSVDRVDGGRTTTILDAMDPMTMDHLMAADGGAELVLAAHQQDGGGISFGAPAAAHDGPATWWRADLGDQTARPALAAGIALDALVTDESTIVWLTRDGLFVSSDGQPVQLLRSRALRFVTTAG